MENVQSIIAGKKIVGKKHIENLCVVSVIVSFYYI